MAGTRKRHDEALLARCVARVLAGERPAGVAEEADIPYSTLMTRVAWKKRGQKLVTPATRKKKRPKRQVLQGSDAVDAETVAAEGDDPLTELPLRAESDLLVWMVRLQRARISVRRRDVLDKANAVLALLGGAPELGAVWFTRFRERHPEITGHGTSLTVNEEAVAEMDAAVRSKSGTAEVSPWTAMLGPTPESSSPQQGSTVASEDAVADAGNRGSSSADAVEAPVVSVPEDDAVQFAEQLDMTPSERAVALLQASYSEKLAPEDLAEAFDVALDPPRAQLLLVLRPGELRDLWIARQVEKQRRGTRASTGM